MRDPAPVSFSVQVYRAMLLAYPAGFRRSFGELMAQVFRDSCLRAYRAGRGGMPALWAGTLLDYITSVAAEQINRGAEMTQTQWIKFSGWALVAGAVGVFLSFLAGSRPEYSPYNLMSLPIDRYANMAAFPLTIVSLLLIIAGLAGLRARFARVQSASVSLVVSMMGGFAVLAGAIGQELTNTSPWWQILMLGMTVMLASLGIFGAISQRRRLFSRWNGIPLVPGIVWVTALLLSMGLSPGLPDYVTGIIFFIVFGGLALTGYRLAAEGGEPAAA